MNFTEFLASEVFGFPTSLNSLNMFCYTHLYYFLYSPFTFQKTSEVSNKKIESDDTEDFNTVRVESRPYYNRLK